ncbi:diguanylate cyclase domain-containing protein [Lysobacter koreensis]|uniref:diguanylate cyclase n=1 Tax=Lysobacter koreensis TaxID=266122 RepID=A0ABW2YK97_9GAMM
MKASRALSEFFPHSYRARLLALVLCCPLLPMLVLVGWLCTRNGIPPERLLFGVTVGLGATLVGTIVSLLLIYKLLDPLRRAAIALDDYYSQQKLPTLPESGDDEIGRLIRGIDRCLRGIDAGRRELERHALEDALTGAMNRRGSEQQLAHSIAMAEGGESFVLFVLDLDNLKPINDAHGHDAGDRVLVSLVDSARARCLGEHDWIGRWGGDEFLIGLRDELGQAKGRIRAWLTALAQPQDGVPAVQVSAGCAHYRPGQSAVELFREADKAMYQAKFSGGHSLVCHSQIRSPSGLDAVYAEATGQQ